MKEELSMEFNPFISDEELANRKAAIVVSKNRSITLEPMTPYERRIIHTTLQNHPKVKTSSTGEEPYRKVTISLR